jgi:hypothetical protein
MYAEKETYTHARPPGIHFSLWEIFAFMLVVSAIGGGWFYVDIQRKREDLTTCKMDLNETGARIEKVRKHVESQRHDVAELQGQVSLLDSLEREKTALETLIPNEERELASQRAQLAAAVREQRAKAAGVVHPELRLLDGEVLTDVRILSVSDSDISVAHAGGVARVPAKRLPEHFQERYRFGIDMVEEAPSSENTVARANTSRLPDAQRQKVVNLNASLVSKKARLLALEKMATLESESELPPKPEGSKSLMKDTEQMRIQRERDKQRYAVALNVKNAEISARSHEINELRSDIAAIRMELEQLYQQGQ